MAKIDHVDYEAMPRQAKAMREYALELNNDIKGISKRKKYIESLDDE